MINPPYNQQKGIVLVYVLLIIFIITAISITISVVIINELKLTSTAADATQAYYAAESGIERGLFTIKRMRADGTQTLQDAVAAIQALQDSLTNGTTYDDADTSEQTAVIENQAIAENHFVQADYYDFEDPLDLDATPNQIAQSLVITNTGTDPDSWAEVSWIAWGQDGTLGESVAARKLIGPTDLANGWTISDLDVFDEIDPRGYRIRIKALFGDISRISVIPYDSLGDRVELPSLIEVKSVGQRSSYKQALTATVPWKIPLFGLYDYVLFSEGDLLKTIILSNPTYSSGPIHVEEALAEGASCNSCGICQTTAGWLALSCLSPAGDRAQCGTLSSADGCSISPIAPAEIWGYRLPIPLSVPEGDEYYVSLRMFYQGTSSGRDIAVEISGQSSVIDDQAGGQNGAWKTCTIPESFPVGSSTLPVSDPSRVIQISDHPYGAAAGGWIAGDSVFVDWYQLSTFKLFQDCQ